MNKAELKKRIFEMDFVIHELVLFLDSHPTDRKAFELLKEYRVKRKELKELYESKYGKLIITTKDVPAEGCWNWLKGPWPWENDFMEG